MLRFKQSPCSNERNGRNVGIEMPADVPKCARIKPPVYINAATNVERIGSAEGAGKC
jgi:hypothetical protein